MGRHVNGATAAVNVVNWFFLVTAVLAVLMRLGTKYFFVRKITRDDWVLCLSLLFAIAQSITTSVGITRQFEVPLDALSASETLRMLHAEYASTLLFIASLCLSKAAALLFVRGLTLDILDQNFTTGLCIFVGVWGVVSEFVVAFQCHLPRPWDYIHNTCFNRMAWWNFFGVVNILTEAALIIHPVIIVSPLRTSLGKKIGIVSCFAGRVIVVVGVIIQLAYLNHAAQAGQSFLENWQNVVCSEAVQCLSIVGTCLPQFKPFLESLQSSGMRLYDIPGTGRKYGYGCGYGCDASPGLNSYKSPQLSHRGRHGGAIHELISVPPRLETTVTAGGKDKDWEVSSLSSQTGIIRETKTWTVTEYPGQQASPGEASVRL